MQNDGTAGGSAGARLSSSVVVAPTRQARPGHALPGPQMSCGGGTPASTWSSTPAPTGLSPPTACRTRWALTAGSSSRLQRQTLHPAPPAPLRRACHVVYTDCGCPGVCNQDLGISMPKHIPWPPACVDSIAAACRSSWPGSRSTTSRGVGTYRGTCGAGHTTQASRQRPCASCVESSSIPWVTARLRCFGVSVSPLLLPFCVLLHVDCRRVCCAQPAGGQAAAGAVARQAAGA